MNGYLNGMTALLVLVFGLIACVQGRPEICASVLPAVPTCAMPCFRSAGTSIGCPPKDFDCECGSFMAAVINSNDQTCLRNECGAEVGSQAQSAAWVVCNCRQTSPTTLVNQASPTTLDAELITAAPKINFPDSDSDSGSYQDPPPTMTADPPSPTSKEHHSLHRFLDRIPLANAIVGGIKDVFSSGN